MLRAMNETFWFTPQTTAHIRSTIREPWQSRMVSINVKVDDHLPQSSCPRSEDTPIILALSGFNLGGGQGFNILKDVRILDCAENASVLEDVWTTLGSKYLVLEDVLIEVRTDQHPNDPISSGQLKRQAREPSKRVLKNHPASTSLEILKLVSNTRDFRSQL